MLSRGVSESNERNIRLSIKRRITKICLLFNLTEKNGIVVNKNRD